VSNGGFSPKGTKWIGLRVGHSPAFNGKVKNAWSYKSSEVIYAHR